MQARGFFFLFSNYIISLVFHNQKNLIMGGGYNFKHQENCQVITFPIFSPQREKPFHPLHYFQGQGHI